MSGENAVGRIGWIDLTTDDAPAIRDFCKAVVGWGSVDVDMEGYDDYMMTVPATGDAVSGICHARGSNADLPPGWIIYIVVADVAVSAARCAENGGKVVVTPRGLAGGLFCVIEDPSGAIAALYQPEAQ